jgi:hypothetical protein
VYVIDLPVYIAGESETKIQGCLVTTVKRGLGKQQGKSMAAKDCLNDFSMVLTVTQGKVPGENEAKFVQFFCIVLPTFGYIFRKLLVFVISASLAPIELVDIFFFFTAICRLLLTARS